MIASRLTAQTSVAVHIRLVVTIKCLLVLPSHYLLVILFKLLLVENEGVVGDTSTFCLARFQICHCVARHQPAKTQGEEEEEKGGMAMPLEGVAHYRPLVPPLHPRT